MEAGLWRPAGERFDKGFRLVACVVSTRHLYLIVEGPPIINPHEVPVMLRFHVTTTDGEALKCVGTDGGGGRRGQVLVSRFEVPPDLSASLTVTASGEDGTRLWQVCAHPVR